MLTSQSGSSRAAAMRAGLEPQPIAKRGKGNRRTWKADGPAATARFASLGCTHKLAWGGAKPMAPSKGAMKNVCRVMTLLAPPLTITHRTTEDEETATIKTYV